MSFVNEAHAGQAVYTKRMLKLYDFGVLGLSNRWIWKCPTSQLLDFYNQKISGNHLDVGVGTGYFLDRCQFPQSNPRVELLDLNPNSLAETAQRIERYKPLTHQANILEPLSIDVETFDSIAVNYLLHCLPGTMVEKAIAFDHLNTVLTPNGTIFGSTLLHEGVPRVAAAKRLMAFYNKKGIFGNREDSLASLEAELGRRYQKWAVEVVGCAALFWASKPKGSTSC